MVDKNNKKSVNTDKSDDRVRSREAEDIGRGKGTHSGDLDDGKNDLNLADRTHGTTRPISASPQEPREPGTPDGPESPQRQDPQPEIDPVTHPNPVDPNREIG